MRFAIVNVRAAMSGDLRGAAQIIADHRADRTSDWVERFRLELADPDRIFLIAAIADEVVGFGQARLTEGSATIDTETPPADRGAIATVLQRDQRASPSDAATLAHIVSAVMFVSMAATINIAHSVDEILEEVRGQVRVLLPH